MENLGQYQLKRRGTAHVLDQMVPMEWYGLHPGYKVLPAEQFISFSTRTG